VRNVKAKAFCSAESLASYSTVFSSPVPGVNVGLIFSGKLLVKLDFIPASVKTLKAVDHFSIEAVRQIQAYFEDPAYNFDLKFQLHGTSFQQRVWQELIKISMGKTLRYGDIAKHLKTAARAVGNACRENPLPIIVPCHRVVSASGLGGFMGSRQGIEMSIKRWLLQHEGYGGI
jgi:methylated-DNA-[protein]-cysteine S-methyltransferase